MTDHLQLGAIEKATNTYTLPSKAVKGVEYSCADCSQRVILRKGQVRKPHFAHFSAETKCNYYEHPNESQIHKDAKLKLAERLRQKFKITISNQCPDCEAWPGSLDFDDIEYNDNDEIIVEYRGPNGKYVADVAVLNNNVVRYIFEIKHTHATTTSVRPEPWFEFLAEEIFKEEMRIASTDPNHPDDSLDKNKYYLDCVRKSTNRYCGNCRIQVEPWAQNIPFLGTKNGEDKNWKQNFPCVGCNDYTYGPVFIKGYRQVCHDCIALNEASLKEKYTVVGCMIED